MKATARLLAKGKQIYRFDTFGVEGVVCGSASDRFAD
jgi:hypothetical protein